MSVEAYVFVECDHGKSREVGNVIEKITGWNPQKSLQALTISSFLSLRQILRCWETS